MWESIRRLNRNTVIGIVAVALALGIPLALRELAVEKRLIQHEFRHDDAAATLGALRDDLSALAEDSRDTQIKVGVLEGQLAALEAQLAALLAAHPAQTVVVQQQAPPKRPIAKAVGKLVHPKKH